MLRVMPQPGHGRPVMTLKGQNHGPSVTKLNGRSAATTSPSASRAAVRAGIAEAARRTPPVVVDRSAVAREVLGEQHVLQQVVVGQPGNGATVHGLVGDTP